MKKTEFEKYDIILDILKKENPGLNIVRGSSCFAILIKSGSVTLKKFRPPLFVRMYISEIEKTENGIIILLDQDLLSGYDKLISLNNVYQETKNIFNKH